MDYQNNNQNSGTKFCANCGSQLPQDAQFCSNCGFNTAEAEVPATPVTPVNPQNTPEQYVQNTPEQYVQNTPEQYVQNTPEQYAQNTPEQGNNAVNPAPVPPQNIPNPYNQAAPIPPYGQQGTPTPPDGQGQPNPPKKKKGKKLLLILIPVILVLFFFFVVVIFGILVATHTICLSHEYENLKCENNAYCIYCGKKNEDVVGHDWVDATCTEDQYCDVCGETGEKAKGHTDGEWIVTKDATILNAGAEELHCSVCDELLDQRSISQKELAVMGSSFNFTVDEFIQYINANDVVLKIGTTELDVDLDAEYSSYSLSVYDGSTGAVIFKEDASGNVCEIVTMFDESPIAVAMIVYVSSIFDPNISSDAAIDGLFSYNRYTTTSGLTLVMTTSDSNYCLTMVAPSSLGSDSI